MRVVSGTYRGRTLKAVPGNATRPTTDKIKESLFNIIGPYFDGGVMIDMYAGSGGIAIEAVSRGMECAFLFEKNRQALQTIQHNVNITKEAEKFHVYKGDVHKLLPTCVQLLQEWPATFVFMDPPYAAQEIEKDILLLEKLKVVSSNCIIVAETDKTVQLSNEIGSFFCYKQVEYGMTALHFYSNES